MQRPIRRCACVPSHIEPPRRSARTCHDATSHSSSRTDLPYSMGFVCYQNDSATVHCIGSSTDQWTFEVLLQGTAQTFECRTYCGFIPLFSMTAYTFGRMVERTLSDRNSAPKIPQDAYLHFERLWRGSDCALGHGYVSSVSLYGCLARVIGFTARMRQIAFQN